MNQGLSFKPTFGDFKKKNFRKNFNPPKIFENFRKNFFFENSFEKATKCIFWIFRIVSGIPILESLGHPNMDLADFLYETHPKYFVLDCRY